MRRIRRSGAAAVAVLVVAGCGGPSGRGSFSPPEPDRAPVMLVAGERAAALAEFAEQADVAGRDADPVALPPPEDYLVERQARTEAERILAESARTNDLCVTVELLASVPEPDLFDLDEADAWAFPAVLAAFDPEAKVPDPEGRVGVTVAPDRAVIDALEIQRAASLRWLGHMRWVVELREAGLLTAQEYATRVEDVFFDLVNGPFTSAQADVARAKQRYCP